MQLINNHIGEAKASPLFDDRLLMAGLFVVCLVTWGPNAFYGQAYGMLIIAIAGLSIMSGNMAVSLFGVYSSCWFAYLLSSGFSGLIPIETNIQTMDAMTLIVCGLIIYVIARYGKTSKETWLTIICIVAVILSIMGIFQSYHGQPARATLGNQNFLGAFLAISAPCFFRPKWWMLLPAILAGLYATHCTTAFTALAVVFGWYLYYYNLQPTFGKRVSIQIAAISLTGVVIIISIFKGFDSLINRVGFWIDAINKLSSNWTALIFGFGPGIVWEPGNMLHSEYAYLLWNFGIAGLLLAAWYIFDAFRRYSDRILFASFLTILIDGIANHLMHTAPTAYLSVIIMALIERDSSITYQEE